MSVHATCSCCVSLAACPFCTSMLHAYAASPCLMSMLHLAWLHFSCCIPLHVHAACESWVATLRFYATCPRCMSALLHIPAASPRCMFLLHVPTACPCCMPCCSAYPRRMPMLPDLYPSCMSMLHFHAEWNGAIFGGNLMPRSERQQSSRHLSNFYKFCLVDSQSDKNLLS